MGITDVDHYAEVKTYGNFARNRKSDRYLYPRQQLCPRCYGGNQFESSRLGGVFFSVLHGIRMFFPDAKFW